jgi:hypothetical protein
VVRLLNFLFFENANRRWRTLAVHVRASERWGRRRREGSGRGKKNISIGRGITLFQPCPEKMNFSRRTSSAEIPKTVERIARRTRQKSYVSGRGAVGKRTREQRPRGPFARCERTGRGGGRGHWSPVEPYVIARAPLAAAVSQPPVTPPRPRNAHARG